ncbi:PAS domain-containing protein, partial [Azohydromonas lata]|uniref:PAS domain-containing protein n=1 Tax=Azohydromonas lata TaxID=45677 RepID=UPI001471D6E7
MDDAWPPAELIAALDLASVFVRGPDGTVLHWSRGCERLYGWSSQEAIGRKAHELLHTEFPVPQAEIRAALERDGEWSGDVRNTTRDGHEIVVAVRKLLRRDDGGRVTAVAEAVTDVTDARQAKAALAELIATLEQQVHQRTTELQHLAEREQALLAIAGSAIIATDLSGRITSINPAAEALLRMPATHALGRLELDFRDHAELLAQLHRYPREVLEHCGHLPLWLSTAARSTLSVMPAELDGGQRSEWTYVRADGTRVVCLMSISLLRNTQGEPSGFLSVMADLSERKALEEQ